MSAIGGVQVAWFMPSGLSPVTDCLPIVSKVLAVSMSTRNCAVSWCAGRAGGDRLMSIPTQVCWPKWPRPYGWSPLDGLSRVLTL